MLNNSFQVDALNLSGHDITAIGNILYVNGNSTDLTYLQTGASGEFYKKSNLNNFISSGNIVGSSGIITYTSGSSIGIAPYPFSKSITVEMPASGNDISLFYTPRPLNINELYAYISGDTNPMVNYSLKFATGRLNMLGTEVNVGGLAVTSTNTGAQQFIFDNNYVSGRTFLWLYINATGGNPKQFGLTMYLNYA